MVKPEGKLRVGVVLSEDKQYEAYECFQNLAINKHCRKPGFEIEIFDSIMKLLKWDYEFVMAKSHGFPDPLNPGNFTGLIGLAQQNKIDMSAVTLRQTPERTNVTDFSFPAWYYKQTYIIKQPAIHDSHQFMLRPFQSSVWLCFCICLVLAIVVEWLVVASIRLKGKEFKEKLFYGQNAFWNFFAILVKQEAQEKFRFSSTILLAQIWGFYCLVIMTYYESTMNSLLAVPLRTKIPFLEIRELIPLLETNEWHLSYYDLPDPIYPECPSVETKERLLKALEDNPVRHPPTVEDNTAFYGTYFLDTIPKRVSMYYRDYKWLMIRDDSVVATFGSFLFQKGSPYRREFDQKLIEILAGIPRIKQRYVENLPPAYEKLKAQKIKLSLDHLRELNVVCGVSVAAAVVTFILELYGWRREKKRELFKLRTGGVSMMIKSQAKIVGLQKTSKQQKYEHSQDVFL